MKKEQFDFKKANARKREIGDRLNELAEKLESKEALTDEQREEIKRESVDLRGELDRINMQCAAALAYMAAEQQGREVTKSRNEVFRELLNDIRSGKRHEREISLSVLAENATNNIVSAGADKVTVQDIMPNLSEGLIWDKVGMKVQTGVAGNLVWPYATDNVKIVEVGETVQLSDQDIDFDKVTTDPKECGATVKVTYAAIEDSTFDVLTFVQESYRLAMQEYLNWKTFSHANFSGIKGPYSNAASTAIAGTYRNILRQKAAIVNSGVDMKGFCYIVDAELEAYLKSTPKGDGQGGFVIENGLLAGDPYFVSHFIRETGTRGTASSDLFLGLGCWQYLAANQHGNVYMTVDPYTLADKGEIKLTIRTRWSLTTLRSEAFKIVKVVPVPAPDEAPFISLDQHTASIVKSSGTVTLTAVTIPADAEVTWATSASGKATVSNGVVTAGSTAGDVTITATITKDGKSYSDSCVVTVTNS
jgi:HK97 family phage major capsid protein